MVYFRSKTRKRNLKKDNPSWPPKYYKGLSKKRATQRRKEILKYGKLASDDPKAYVGFKTDIGVKTRTSSYVTKLRQMIGDVKSLKEKSEITGVPVDLLQESYNRGMAAWRTGHRPGATQQQWGYGRVASLLTCGKTHYGPDSDLVREAKKRSKTAKQWFSKCPTTHLTQP